MMVPVFVPHARPTGALSTTKLKGLDFLPSRDAQILRPKWGTRWNLTCISIQLETLLSDSSAVDSSSSEDSSSESVSVSDCALCILLTGLNVRFSADCAALTLMHTVTLLASGRQLLSVEGCNALTLFKNESLAKNKQGTPNETMIATPTVHTRKS